MKKILLSLFAFLAVLLAPVTFAATAAQFDAWKKEFPAASAADPAALQTIASTYETLVKQVTPATAAKLLPQIKDKMTKEQARLAAMLNPPKAPKTPLAPEMRAAAELTEKWLTGKFAPFLAKAPK